MSTNAFAYGEQLQLPVPRQRAPAVGRKPAFGEAGPPPEVETAKETRGPLDRRTEALLGFAIVTPVLAAYGVIGYGLYALLSGSL
jgi:hypothetical protein